MSSLARASALRNISNKLLIEISRAVYPLADLNVTASADFPLTHPQLKSYLARLDKGAHVCTQTPKPTSKECVGVNPYMQTDLESRSSKPIGAVIDQKAALFPISNNEKLAWRTVGVFGVEIRIYKNPINLDEYTIGAERRKPDLHFRVRANKVSLTYMFEKPGIEIYAEHMKVDPDDVNSNGSITSVTDLSGAQMFIYFYDYDTGDDNIDYPYLEIEQGAELRPMLLYVGNRKFPIEGFKKVPNIKYPTYVYTFPTNYSVIQVD